VPKYRHKCINKELLSRLEEIVESIFTTWKCEIDHFHILFEAPPQVQLSKLINNFKTVSSRYVRKKFPEHLSKYYWKKFFWSQSHLVISTGGATIDVIKHYIEEQNAPQ
jgi:putative transposase